MIAEASTGADTNISQFLVIDAEGKRAYLPQTRPNASNTAMTFDTTVFPVVNIMDIKAFQLLVRERITIDTADQPSNMPFAAGRLNIGRNTANPPAAMPTNKTAIAINMPVPTPPVSSVGVVSSTLVGVSGGVWTRATTGSGRGVAVGPGVAVAVAATGAIVTAVAVGTTCTVRVT